MEITEGTIFNIDLTRDGKIIFKVRKKTDGPFEPLSEEEIKDAVVGKGAPIEGQFSFSRVISVIGLEKNPIKVYVTLPPPDGRTICYLFDSNTFQYLGSC